MAFKSASLTIPILVGAVIVSTQQAIQADYQANAMSASVGGGIQAGLIVLSGAGIGKDEDQASSVTVSAISTGSVNITDSPRSKPSQAKML